MRLMYYYKLLTTQIANIVSLSWKYHTGNTITATFHFQSRGTFSYAEPLFHSLDVQQQT